MQSWMLLIIVIISILPIAMVSKEIIQSEGQDQNAIIAAIIVVVSLLLVFGILVRLKLSSRIDERGIHYRFSPFHRSFKLISWNAIQEVHIRNYKPISEYGGWGMRSTNLWNRKKGIAYIISGNQGIQLVLKSGKKILIGTRKSEEVKRALVTYKEKLTRDEN